MNATLGDRITHTAIGTEYGWDYVSEAKWDMLATNLESAAYVAANIHLYPLANPEKIANRIADHVEFIKLYLLGNPATAPEKTVLALLRRMPHFAPETTAVVTAVCVHAGGQEPEKLRQQIRTEILEELRDEIMSLEPNSDAFKPELRPAYRHGHASCRYQAQALINEKINKK